MASDSSKLDLWMRIWLLHSFFYGLSTTIPVTFYQAYAIRVLGFDVESVGTLTFINIFSISIGNFFGLLIVYRFRSWRLLLWKIFTSLNLVFWSTSGFTDLIGYPQLFPLFIGLAQFTGSIGGLAYSDNIADIVPRERSIKVFSRLGLYMTIATFIGLLSSMYIFHQHVELLYGYRLCYSIALASALFSIVFLNMLWVVVERESVHITFKQVVSRFRMVSRDGGIRSYLIYMYALTFSTNLVGAIWNYYIIKVYHGDETWISLNNISSTLATMIGNYLLSRIHGRVKPRQMIITSTVLVSAIPIGFLYSPTMMLQVILNLYSGFTWSLLNNMANIYNLYLAGSENRIYLLSMLGIFNNLLASTASKIGSTISSYGLLYMNMMFIASGLGRLLSAIYGYRKLKNI